MRDRSPALRGTVLLGDPICLTVAGPASLVKEPVCVIPTSWAVMARCRPLVLRGSSPPEDAVLISEERVTSIVDEPVSRGDPPPLPRRAWGADKHFALASHATSGLAVQPDGGSGFCWNSPASGPQSRTEEVQGGRSRTVTCSAIDPAQAPGSVLHGLCASVDVGPIVLATSCAESNSCFARSGQSAATNFG